VFQNLMVLQQYFPHSKEKKQGFNIYK